MQIDKFIVNKEKSSVIIEGEIPNPFKGRIAELLFATEQGKQLFLTGVVHETFSRYNECYPIPMKVELLRFEEHTNSDSIVFAFKIKSFIFGKDRYTEGGRLTKEQQQEHISNVLPFNIENTIHWLSNHMHSRTILGRIAKYFPKIAKYGYVYEHTNGFSRLAEQLRIELQSSSKCYHEGHATITLVQAITHSRATSFLVSEEAITNLFRAICIPHGVNPALITGRF